MILLSGTGGQGTSATPGIAPIGFDDLEPALREQLRPRYERLGYLGAFFQYAAHQPRALAAFDTFTEALKQALPEPITQLVALTIAAATDNRYERHQHEQLALRLGLSREWVSDRVRGAAPDDPRERAVHDLVVGLLAGHGHGVRDRLGSVVELLGPEAAVAVLLLAGRYLAHAVVANALELPPPVPSVTESDGRDDG